MLYTKYNDKKKFAFSDYLDYLEVMNRLTLLRPMEFPKQCDTFKSEWSIVYIEGSQLIISKTNYISFSED